MPYHLCIKQLFLKIFVTSTVKASFSQISYLTRVPDIVKPFLTFSWVKRRKYQCYEGHQKAGVTQWALDSTHQHGALADIYLTWTGSPDTSVPGGQGQRCSSKRWFFRLNHLTQLAAQEYFIVQRHHESFFELEHSLSCLQSTLLNPSLRQMNPVHVLTPSFLDPF